jgi:hypothetical protein
MAISCIAAEIGRIAAWKSAKEDMKCIFCGATQHYHHSLPAKGSMIELQRVLEPVRLRPDQHSEQYHTKSIQ